MEPFAWSDLTRNALYNMLKPAGANLIGKNLRIDKVQSHIRRQIKAHIPVLVRQCRRHEFNNNAVGVGGAYHSDRDRKKNRSLEVMFVYSPLHDHIQLTTRKWHNICRLFADTVLHEIIHMRQNRARKYKNIPGYRSTAYRVRQRNEQEYLGNSDEIGAYAFNIACEMQDRFGSDWGAIKRFMDSTGPQRTGRSSLLYYLKTFDWNHKHVVIRRLKRKVANVFPRALAGKPFKNSAHLMR